MPFDVDGAKKAGYSDAEIADYLAKGSNYDAAGARKAGYTDAQIIGHLTMDRKPPEPPKPQGFGAQLSAALDEIPRQVGLTARHGIEGRPARSASRSIRSCLPPGFLLWPVAACSFQT